MRKNTIFSILTALSLGVFALFSASASAQYGQYYMHPLHELEQRVQHLERVISQMQMHMDELADEIHALRGMPSAPPAEPTKWTCHIEAGGTPYSSTKPTRGEATAKALEKCHEGVARVECTQARVICDPY